MAFKMKGFNPGEGTGLNGKNHIRKIDTKPYAFMFETESNETPVVTNKRRLKEVKSSIRDLRIERLKKIGNKRAQDNLKSAIAGLKEKKKQLKNK